MAETTHCAKIEAQQAPVLKMKTGHSEKHTFI